jgi:hypothetical protein
MVTRAGPALRSAIVLLPLVLIGACRELAPEGYTSEAARTPELLVFVYDRSNSIQEHELTHARDLTRQRVSVLDHGDRIVAIDLLQQSLEEEPRRWSLQVPEREFPGREMRSDSVSKARFLQDVRDYIGTFSEPEGRENIGGTDILSTLHLVASELRAVRDHRATLVIYSDMLQANQGMNMEGLLRMPPANWVETEMSRGTLPDLTGLCVVAVGARSDTRAAQTVKAFWMEYFQATGATLLDQNYVYRPVTLPERACPGV